MTIRSRDEFQNLLNSLLPDNTTREISPEDMRSVFTDLADSIGSFLAKQEIVSLNFATPDTRTTIAGEDALKQIDLTGRSSVDNSALGYGALQFSYNGERNTAIGSESLKFLSLGHDNVAIGKDTLCATTAGSGNVAVGNFALQKNKRGDFNIAIGCGAGHYVDDNSSFKLYLGSFPDASGDCDTTYDQGKPPLIYGDLLNNQLGIGVKSFHNDTTALQVSGNIIPHESGGSFSLGSGSYTWDAYLNNVYISGELSYPLSWDFNITDGAVAPNLVVSGDTIHISGVSGIKTEFLDLNENKYVFISANPISGWAESNLNAISGDNGLLNSISGYPNGLIYQASGSLASEINEVSGVGGHIDQVSGWSQYNFSAISGFPNGLLYQSSGSLASEINSVSGVGGIIDQVSGYLGDYDQGLIYLVSGWNKGYTDAQVGAAGGYTFWELEGQYGASGIINHADTVIISGCSGVETILDFNENGVTNNYRLNINAAPISGYIDAREAALNTSISTNSNDIDEITDVRLPQISGYPNGLLYLASGSLASEINEVSGVGGQIDSVSGWTYDNLNLLSGVHDGPLWGGRPSGLIFQVSGFLKHYIDNKDLTAGGYNHWKVETIDDYDTTRSSFNVDSKDTVLFSGVDGISISGYEDSSLNTVEISASPISGYFESRLLSVIDDIETNTEVNNSQANSITDLEGNIASTGRTLLKEIDTISGVNGTLKQTSGNLNNTISSLSGYLSNYPEGLIYLVSGWNKNYTDTQVDFNVGEDGYGYWRIGDATEINYQVGSTDKVNAIGKDGISTQVRQDAGVNYLDISASPLSGLMANDLNSISGIGGIIDERIKSAGGDGTFFAWVLSDSVRDSQIQGTDKAKFVGVSGIETFLEVDNDKVLISAHPLSGYLDSRIDGISSQLDCIKGVNCPDSNTECCDNVSGWAQTNLNILSGIAPTVYGPSGLIWSVSGYNKSYTDQQIQGLSLSSDSYSHWRISDGTTIRSIRGLEETQFLGVSGIETQTRTTGASGLTISAGPLSGWANYNFYNELGQTRIRAKQAKNDAVAHANLVSGSLVYEINQVSGYPNGLVYQVSGWTAGELNSISGVGGQIDAVSGWSLENLTQISGFNGIIDQVSGWTGYNLDAISGVDGVIDQDVSAMSGALNNELNLLSGVADNLWNGYPSGLIWQVSGIFNTVSALNLTAGSGLILENDEFRTHGSGTFNKVILSRNSDPSGQIVADSGGPNNIVNSSGYLVTPFYDKRTTLETAITPSAANSGAIFFAGDHPVRSQGSSWSRPVNIEGFLLDDLLAPTSYNNPTSGRLTVMDDQFSTSDVVYVTNRDSYLSISGTLFCVASLVNGEYRPIYHACSGA